MSGPSLVEVASRYRVGVVHIYSDITTHNDSPVVAVRWPGPQLNLPPPPGQKPKPLKPWPEPYPAADCEPFPAGLVCQLRVNAVAMSTTKTATFERVGLFVRFPSGVLSQTLTTEAPLTIADDTTWDLLLAVSGQQVVVQVKGDIDQKTRWFINAQPLGGLYPFA